MDKLRGVLLLALLLIPLVNAVGYDNPNLPKIISPTSNSVSSSSGDIFMTGSNKIFFRDYLTYINSPNIGQLDIFVDSGDLHFRGMNTITTDSSIIPSSGGAYNIGDPALTFSTGYFDELDTSLIRSNNYCNGTVCQDLSKWGGTSTAGSYNVTYNSLVNNASYLSTANSSYALLGNNVSFDNVTADYGLFQNNITISDINVGSGIYASRAFVGAWPNSANYAIFKHRDCTAITCYAVAQTAGGATFISTGAGTNLAFNVNAVNKLVINGTGSGVGGGSAILGGDFIIGVNKGDPSTPQAQFGQDRGDGNDLTVNDTGFFGGNITVNKKIKNLNATAWSGYIVCYMPDGTLGHATAVNALLNGQVTCVDN